MVDPSPMGARLAEARDAGRKLLIPYLTAGFPDRDTTLPALEALAEAGADAVELGIPFSDPLADGPVIAAASQRAIAGGVTLEDALEICAAYAVNTRPPLVLFTYLNPLWARGVDRAAAECADAGFAGVLIADLPFDEGAEVSARFAARGLPLIRLAAPTTPTERLRVLARLSEGFVYLIARTGVTGEGAGADERLAEQVEVLREETALPIVVGFGIGDADSARRAALIGDGIVVGTAYVERLDREGPEAAAEWIAELRDALDRV
ncbi:MAG: tryptophan synthase subunit alpha [Gemmatimonadota bacterium]|nr:tryptophan synthase subunit alpha [Gemmatimonadota bacterium]